MKKVVLVSWLLCWALMTMAQEKTMVITPVKKGEEPQEIMKALKEDFPSSVIDQFSFLPSTMYGKEWNISVQGDEAVTPEYYQVELRKANEKYTAVYNKSGKLLSSKHVIENAFLPIEVNKTVKTYTGWHIDKTQEIIEFKDKGKSFSNVYKIKLQKGVNHKNIFVSPKGELLNERIVINIGD